VIVPTSGRILRACENRAVILLLSRPVIAEYRFVLGSPDITDRQTDITHESVELVLRRLRYVGEYLKKVKARLERDRRDEKFVELAIAGEATHVVTNDNDLLSLATGHDEAAKRFRQRLPNVQMLDPAQFARQLLPDTEVETIV
jgi:putative PIN family toxin of toxin-antitoxin system